MDFEKRLTRIFVSVAAMAMLIIAFLRGNFLLGLDGGTAYVVVVAGLLSLFVNSLRRQQRAARLQQMILALLVIPIGFVLAFPAWINPEIQVFINKQSIDRNVRQELNRVFDSDPAFTELSVDTTHLKVVNVTISGSLPTNDDSKRLLKYLESDCPTLKLCPLHWKVRLRDSKEWIQQDAANSP